MQLSLAVPAGFLLARVAQSHGWYDLVPFSWDKTRLSTVAHVGGAAHDIAIEARGARAIATTMNRASCTELWRAAETI